MFDVNTGINWFNYKLNFENIVNAICNLAFDIRIQIEALNNDVEEIVYAVELFNEEFIIELGERKSDLIRKDQASGEYELTKEEFFARVAKYYNDKLFHVEDILNNLSNSDINLINKEQTYLLAKADSRTVRSRVVKEIRKGGILQSIISKINNDRVKSSLDQINLLEHSAIYSDTFEITEIISDKVLLDIFEYNFLEEKSIKKEEVDSDNIWINLERFNIDFNSETDTIYIVKNRDGGESLGLQIKDYFIPFEDEKLIKHIKNEKLFDFYWLLFKSSYSLKKGKSSNFSDIVNEFRTEFTSLELNKLLSYLKNNLYLTNDIEIEDRFKKYFDEIVLIQDLKHISDFDFLISQNDSETGLGVYSKEKIGKDYNLLHWINHNSSQKIDHFKGNNNPDVKNKKLVSALKPEISFYFLEKYFEDLLEKSLKKNDYHYLSNISLGVKTKKFETEVDFLVKGKDKFYYVEAKTKLSKYYIEAYLKKASKVQNFMDEMIGRGVDVEFLLVGGYSDASVSDFQYFIDKEEPFSHYNKEEVSLNSIPYFFKVPIPDKKEREIICIAEPRYEKLTKLFQDVCQK